MSTHRIKALQAKKNARDQLKPYISCVPAQPFTVQEIDLSTVWRVSEEDISNFEKSIEASLTPVSEVSLFTQCRQSIIENITTPLGLGHFVAAYDRVGGNVDTIHNSRQVGEDGLPIGSDKLKQKVVSNPEYDSYEYHAEKNYKQSNAEKSEQKKNGTLTDAYTGDTIDPNSSYDQDHTISAHEIHNDPGRLLADLKGKDLANDDSNLTATDPTINRSKKAETMAEFVERLERTREKRQQDLANLENKSTLSDAEQKKLKKLKKLEEADVQLMLAADEKARAEYNKKINVKYYTSKEFAKDLAKTSGVEGLKMGLQQAVGLLLVDVSNALLDELIMIYHHGFMENTCSNTTDAIKTKLERVAHRAMNNWQKMVSAFRDGTMSGVLSNLITTLINAFLTTAKNIIRLIREGTLVLYKAAKMILFPPPGTCKEECWDAALKLIVSGVVTLGGITLEEYFSKMLGPISWLGPAADTLSIIAAGILTGIATTCALYTINKWDPFGVHDIKKRRELATKIREIGIESMNNLQALEAKLIPLPS